ncbi:MAG: UDP-N-acetylmuramoyl-tripeptide--D-alanyl-D-alanine ligase [Pirellulales bacterium]
MRPFTLGELHEAVGGQLVLSTTPLAEGIASPIARIVTDSRQVQPGDVFFALSGSRLDGADFAEEAYLRGAAGVVSAKKPRLPWAGRWGVCVEDAQAALWRLAAWKRRRFRGTVVAVTGSVGKTTTRQMIETVLRSRLTGSASPRNFNNHVGVPLSMLGMEEDHDYAVLELGASCRGEIAELARLCEPKIGVLTRVAEAHLAGFGSQRGVAESKAELLSSLPEDGWAVLGDDPLLRRVAGSCRAKTLWIGRGADCDVMAGDVHWAAGRLSFQVEDQRFAVPVWGRHHLTAALAAVAVGRLLGLTLEEIAEALADFDAPPMRCEVTSLAGVTIINDSYNANPTAMRAALELLRDCDAPGRRIVVCGDMRELGETTPELHRQLGDEVVTVCGADLLLACGEHSEDVVAGARAAGMSPSRTIACREPEETVPYLEQTLAAGDVILVKGSRAMALERVIDALEMRPQRRCA